MRRGCMLAGLLWASLVCHSVVAVSWVRDCDDEACANYVCGDALRCVRGYRVDDWPPSCSCYPRTDCGDCYGANSSCVCTGMNCIPGLLSCADLSCIVDEPTTAAPTSTTSSA